nr:MAG TPA: hypothetical protein [Caudoviricetes sp.]
MARIIIRLFYRIWRSSVRLYVSPLYCRALFSWGVLARWQ